MTACKDCLGSKVLLYANSHMTADGYRRQKCATCAGSGINPPGFTANGAFAHFQRVALARVAEWGGLKPAGQRENGGAE